MAAREVYDYVATVTPDVDVTLTVAAQGIVSEESGGSNVVIHTADDTSEERIILDDTSVFFISWDWNALTAADSGTIMDLYHTSAHGRAYSFKYQCAADGHTYVVRFDCDLTRRGQAYSRMGFSGIRLKVLGRIADA